MNYKTDTNKGLYKPIHPEKYLGSRLPSYKSGWEKRVFYAMDINPFILKWGYECIEIYYHHPIFNAFTVYYPDIFCHVKNERGHEEKILIEIKPSKMCLIPKEPKPPKNKTSASWDRYQRSLKRYQGSCKDYIVNQAKWEAAQNWCLRHGVTWRILNEDNSSGLFTKRM
jgi:hypothetical protein